MAKSIPVEIGSLTFKSKKEAKDAFRSMVAKYPDRHRIEAQDDAVLRDLICLHPESEAKIGCGIAHFSVAIDQEWRTTRHFVIIRVDGTSTDFSYHTCIDGTKMRQDIYAALRFAVWDQVVEFKRVAYTGGTLPRCFYHDRPLTEPEAHVDHEAPYTFLVLVNDWLRSTCLTLDSLLLVDNADNQWVRKLRNKEQTESWQAYHRQNAKLRIISKRANLSDARKQRTIA